MINNYQKGKIELDKIERSGTRPSLLLHVCCGPCSTYPLELLNKYFDITIYFNNSNIFLEKEYYLRLKELKRYVEYFNNKNGTDIKIIETNYDYENYIKRLPLREKFKENGPQCNLCYYLRMNEAFVYAEQNNYSYCSTAMSMSRQKNEQIINRIGKILGEKHPTVKFLIHNFKKKGGQERREEIVKSLQLYDQNYCGCEFSLNQKK